jgi:hypothetical protein
MAASVVNAAVMPAPPPTTVSPASQLTWRVSLVPFRTTAFTRRVITFVAPAGPWGPWMPCGPSGPCGPAGPADSWPDLKSFASSEPLSTSPLFSDSFLMSEPVSVPFLTLLPVTWSAA